MMQSELGVFYANIFKDKRIDIRANIFLSSLITSGSAIVNQSSSMHSEKIGSDRMLNNTKCGEKELSEALYASCKNNTYGQHLLCIQDTTQINYYSNKERIKNFDADLGRIDCRAFGYLCHLMLVIDADKNIPI